MEFNDRRTVFGIYWTPPAEPAPATPAKQYSYRAGTEKKLADPERDVHGQMYAFRPTTEYERNRHDVDERMRVHRGRQAVLDYPKQQHARLWAAGDQASNMAPASHWPEPAAKTQHGEYTLAHYPAHGWGVVAFHGDTPVAQMQLAKASPERGDKRMYINMVETVEGHQRKGIARAMWNFGQEQTGGNLRHSLSRTAHGEAFAQSVGGQDTLGRHLGPQFRSA